MNSKKWKLNVMILQTNLAMCSTNFIATMNQVHYIDNQFSLNIWPISLQVVNNFTIWYPCPQFYKINFKKYIIWFHKERYIMY
jgi:hypothetical protein